MHEYNNQKESEISITESRFSQLRLNYEPYKEPEDIVLISLYSPS